MKYKYILTIIITYLIGLCISVPYRNYIFLNNIDDFGLASMGSSLVSIILLCNISWVMKWKLSRNKVLDIIIITLMYIIVEISSFAIPIIGTFDYFDIIALMISALLTFCISLMLDFTSTVKDLNDLGNILSRIKSLIIRFPQ